MPCPRCSRKVVLRDEDIGSGSDAIYTFRCVARKNPLPYRVLILALLSIQTAMTYATEDLMQPPQEHFER
jgi:hypothetical protein